MIPAISPCIASGAINTPFDAAFVAGSYVQQTATSTTVNQTIDVGPADPTRIVAIVVGSTVNTSITSAKINGTAATYIQSSGNNAFSAIIYAAVPLGNTIDLEIITGSTPGGLAFGAYRMVGTGLLVTPSSTSNPAGGGGSTRTATLSNTLGGVSIVTGRVNSNSAIVITNVVMNIDTIFIPSDARLKAGINFPTVSGSLGYALGSARCIVGAHWAAPS